MLVVAITAYALSHVDLNPDFVPILGYIYDLILIPAGIARTLKSITDEVIEDSRLKATSLVQKPINWWVRAGIILVWLVIILLVIRAVIPLIAAKK